MDLGILGMNARNMSYIKKFNDKKAIRLADNKEKTKQFLRERGIPVPETYDLISSRQALWKYNFGDLPVDEFIIKPVRGSRGRGIYKVKHLGAIEHIGGLGGFSLESWFTKQSPWQHDHYKVGDSIIDDRTFRRYLLDILYGKNSLSSDKDEVLIEELLVPGDGFKDYCTAGLADIRVIVFNLIPVAAMLRLPTKESDGKANLDRGAVGMGIEVGSGKISGLYHKGNVYRNSFPDEFKHFAHQTLPYREEILLYSSKIQYFANLGYLALDRVITNDGPKLLEINARAGLKFQLATHLPIKKRLQKLADLKVVTPEKGVEIAQTLFSHHKKSDVSSSKLLYLMQHGQLHTYNTPDEKNHKKNPDTISAKQSSGKQSSGNSLPAGSAQKSPTKKPKKVSHNVIIEININKRHSYCSQDIWPDVKNASKTLLETDFGVKIPAIRWKKLPHNQKNRVILGKNVVSGYFLKPINKVFTKLNFINPKNLVKSEVDDMHILDQRIATLSTKLNTSRIFRPSNYLEEMDRFISQGGNYNPQFSYKRPTKKSLNAIADELQELKNTYFGSTPLQSKFSHLFAEKISNLQDKHTLIEAYVHQDIQGIIDANAKYFGGLDTQLIEDAKQTFDEKAYQSKKVLGPILKRQRVYSIVQNHLKKLGIHNVKIKFDASPLGRISVRRGRQLTITIAETAKFREQELLATLAHEIDVHVVRYQAGFATGWSILKSGTAGYITDEEGLAIYKSFQYLPDEYEKIGMYQKYYLLSIAGTMSFKELAAYIYENSRKTLIGSFNGALRLKKGLVDTGAKDGAVFLKGKIYLEGYTRILNRVEEGGDIEKLMIGKIKIADLPYIY